VSAAVGCSIPLLPSLRTNGPIHQRASTQECGHSSDKLVYSAVTGQQARRQRSPMPSPRHAAWRSLLA
jgi:hypothetical protein